MSKNLTNLHKKMDRMIEKIAATDETKTTVQQLAELNRNMARSLGILTKIAVESREEGQRAMRKMTAIQNDVAMLTQEALKASRESAERTAQILAEIRKH